MAEEIIKIKIDDSEEKRYDKEHQARLKVQTAREIEEEKRKTASLKSELKLREQAVKNEYEKAKRSEQELADLQRRYINEQIKNINRLADAEKKRNAEIENGAINRLKKATQQNTLNTNVNRTLGGFTGGSVNELRQQVIELKKFRDNLSTNDALIPRINQRIRELNNSLTMLTRTTKTSSAQWLEMGENMATIGIGLKLAASQIMAIVRPLKDFAISSITTGAELNVLRKNFKGSAEDLELFRKATAGTVTEANLIKLSNQSMDLGLTLQQQALFMSLAEDAADKYGGSVEENFQKLLYATESGTKGLKQVGIQQAQYQQELERLVKEQKGSVEVSQLENGEKEITIKNLDAETQKRLKVQAILNLTGVTLNDVTNKQKDNKDIVDSLAVTYDTFSTNLGDAFGSSAMEMVDNFNSSLEVLGLTSQNTGLTVGKLAGAIGQAVAALFKFGSAFGIVINTFPKFIDGVKKIWEGVNATNRILGLPAPSGWSNSIMGALEGIIQKIRQAIYLLGMLPSNKATEELPANKGFLLPEIKTKNPSSNSGNSGLQDKQEELNLIKIEEENLKKLNTQLQANLGDIGSELQLRKEILDVELKIFELRTGQKINLGATLEGRNSLNIGTAGVIQRYIGINSRAGNNPEQDFTSDMLKPIELTFDNIKSVADEMLGSFQQMLQFSGLMETDFGKIIQMIQMLFNTGSSISSIISTVLSFIPGGSVIGGIGGGGGMMKGFDPLGGGMPHGGNLNVIVNSEVEKTKSVKFYQGTLPEYERRLAYKSI